jgi:hypothetical protein
MACNGHTTPSTCATHANSCPAHGGAILPESPTVWTTSPLTTSTKFITVHHNELRNAIDDEMNRRGQTWPTDPGTKSTSDKILSDNIRQLRNGINAAKVWTWPSYMNDTETEVGDQIQKDQYNAMRDQVNVMETECICDCNYACTCQCNYACTCDCNYDCTCNCNYCTCNCNYCTCQCNYTCTCDCNYISDVK